MLDAEKLHRLAREGARLLAPNLRAARQLRQRFATLSASPAEAAPLADRVLHWRAWTTSLWQQTLVEGHDERILLHPLQERLIWEQILDRDRAVERTDALIDLCLSATTLLYRHKAVDAFLGSRRSSTWDDLGRFAQWFREFQERCDGELLLPLAALETALAEHTPHTAMEQTLVLCDLAGLSPAQNALLAALSNQGAMLVEAPRLTVESSSVGLLRCPDLVGELSALAQRIAEALQSPERPDIVVVVPDLASNRDRIDRTLREALHTPLASAFDDNRHPIWEFSTGRPLAAVGVIADALHLLTWTMRELDAGEVSLLLRSRNFDWPTDADTAASLDAALLRRHPNLRGTWNPLATAQLLKSSSPTLAEILLRRTASWPGLRANTGSFTSFVERARRTLRDFGWFRSPGRSSADFQAVTRFEQLLDDLSALDLVSGNPPTWPDFLQRLTAAARDISFAPENTGGPVQFLTPDESTGVTAAELWVMHADEDRWSTRAASHPLLPRSLQQEHGMPGADAALDQTRLREQVERITSIAPAVTFSYAHIGESGEQRPSPVIAALPQIRFHETSSIGTVERLHAAADLHPFQDDDLIPLELTGNSIQGGVSTLQSQAACAFRAFAERRLGSAALDQQDLGFDARDRGNLLHHALQLFWSEHRTSAALKQMIREGRFEGAVHRAIQQALTHNSDRSDRWSAAYLEIQRTNLHRLLCRWLRKEAERPDFRVLTTEAQHTVTVGPLPITVRIDRIDEVTAADGTHARVIIDYKTGSPNAKKWEGERPDEPQLPLYAVSLMAEAAESSHTEDATDVAGPLPPVGAIAFGVVRAGDTLDFITAPKNTAWLSTSPKANNETLDKELEDWRNSLQTLAEEFADGIARVGPKEYPATCRFCEQRLLCRLNPALLDADEAETEG